MEVSANGLKIRPQYPARPGMGNVHALLGIGLDVIDLWEPRGFRPNTHVTADTWVGRRSADLEGIDAELVPAHGGNSVADKGDQTVAFGGLGFAKKEITLIDTVNRVVLG